MVACYPAEPSLAALREFGGGWVGPWRPTHQEAPMADQTPDRDDTAARKRKSAKPTRRTPSRPRPPIARTPTTPPRTRCSAACPPTLRPARTDPTTAGGQARREPERSARAHLDPTPTIADIRRECRGDGGSGSPADRACRSRVLPASRPLAGPKDVRVLRPRSAVVWWKSRRADPSPPQSAVPLPSTLRRTVRSRHQRVVLRCSATSGEPQRRSPTRTVNAASSCFWACAPTSSAATKPVASSSTTPSATQSTAPTSAPACPSA